MNVYINISPLEYQQSVLTVFLTNIGLQRTSFRFWVRKTETLLSLELTHLKQNNCLVDTSAQYSEGVSSALRAVLFSVF